MDIEALMSRVVTYPEDVSLRAAVADALTDRGDPRGEYIAAQLHRDPRHEQVAAELHAVHELAWSSKLREIAALGQSPSCYGYRRGFVERVSLTGAEWCASGKAVAAAVPLRALVATAVEEDQLRIMAEAKWLPALEELDLRVRSIDEPALRSMLGRCCPTLKALSLTGPLRLAALRAVVDSGVLAGLDALTVETPIGDAAAELLASAVGRLRKAALRLGLSSKGTHRLCAAPLLRDAIEVDLSDNRVATGLGQLEAVERLTLQRTGLAAGVTELVDLKSLRRLDLAGVPGVIRPLVAAGIPRIAALSLRGCGLSSEMLHELTTSLGRCEERARPPP